LPYYSFDGLRFYLPTYLLAALDDFGDLIEAALIYITIPEAVALVLKHETFTPEQIRAIRLYLEYVRDDLPNEQFYHDLAVPALAELWPSERK
jgi:hypothetical protein